MTAFFVCALLLVAVSQCVSTTTRGYCPCKFPACRQWNDPNIPGNFTRLSTPQMVLVSFDYAVNSANVNKWTDTLRGIRNPNGCEAKGTFFVQQEYTDFKVVKKLYDDGHEIGMTSEDGKVPKTSSEWVQTLTNMRRQLERAGIPAEKIQGVRSPELLSGGNDQFNAMEKAALTYDSTCVTVNHVTRSNLLWPFTYDCIENVPKCTIGSCPDRSFPGKWEFLVAALEYNNVKCAAPSGCSPYIKNSTAAFTMLYEAFKEHYAGDRTPFVLNLDPLWLSVDYQIQGTWLFLQVLQYYLSDTWIVTHQQALEWIKNPVSSARARSYGPWSC